ncbi:hypothetical protein Moror_2591 [Moniliophthora roreri MCA 2997]|uniref:Uncharacterized protein n=1 Tax=Moniliophthora roreri (strain MCA 2997) TaxID=1381753 RepID=V2XCU9_MONRO|nr:hypothetical protein Moror_2591 [Moniliophthora roreri MCA 2997]
MLKKEQVTALDVNLKFLIGQLVVGSRRSLYLDDAHPSGNHVADLISFHRFRKEASCHQLSFISDMSRPNGSSKAYREA